MCESYNGWSNRETWATGLHINNDEGWSQSVADALRDGLDSREDGQSAKDWISEQRNDAAAIIREQVESVLTVDGYREMTGEDCLPASLSRIAEDIGSLYRVDWYELAEAFLSDIAEEQS